jgi:SulP family sulfate permease
MRTAVRGVDVYEINGPLGFDALATFKRVIDSIAERPRAIILRMGRVLAIDDRGLRTLAEIVRRFRREGTRVILCELHARPRVAIERCSIMGDVGEENVTESLAAAVALAAVALARGTSR